MIGTNSVELVSLSPKLYRVVHTVPTLYNYLILGLPLGARSYPSGARPRSPDLTVLRFRPQTVESVIFEDCSGRRCVYYTGILA